MDKHDKLVDAEGLLEALFDQKSRPTVRWVRKLQSQRAIPIVKIGGLVRFDVAAVKKAIAEDYTVRARESQRRLN